VETSGFGVEGHFNGPGDPHNNWYGWERDGRVEPSGIAVDFWHRYEDHLDRAAATGCDGFRLSVEWARCQPVEGEWDTTALDRYAAIIAACRERHLEPVVALHHFVHPSWLGEDFWLRLDSPECFAAWVAMAVGRIGHGVRNWITLHEINTLALQTYLTGRFPPGRRLRVGQMVRATDHLLAAHVFGYAEIHRRHPDAVVTTNTRSGSIYELDRLLGDVLMSRVHGIARADLGRWLDGRRVDYHDAIGPVRTPTDRLARGWARRWIPLEQALPRAVAAVYDSPHESTLDVTQLNSHAPSANLPVSSHRYISGGRSRASRTHVWEDRPHADGLRAMVAPNVAPQRDLWIVGNGIGTVVHNGRAHVRSDGWTRPRYLREHLRSMVEAIDGGQPIKGYYHRSLVDGYEWGSYGSRFGLFGVDRERGLRVSDTDAAGHDSAGTYRRIIGGLRAGDRSVLTS